MNIKHKTKTFFPLGIISFRCWHSRDYADNMRLLYLLYLRGWNQSCHLYRRGTIADDVRRDVSSHHQRHHGRGRTGNCNREKSHEWTNRSARVSYLCRVFAFSSYLILILPLFYFCCWWSQKHISFLISLWSANFAHFKLIKCKLIWCWIIAVHPSI